MKGSLLIVILLYTGIINCFYNAPRQPLQLHDKYLAPKELTSFNINGVQIRIMEPTSWITANSRSSAGFMKLYSYISGCNSAKFQMPMSVPVITRLDKNTISFYLPMQNPPKPVDKSLKIDKLPCTTLAVRQYSGFATQAAIKQNYEILKKQLDNMGITYDSRCIVSAEYDDPMTLEGRKNEIWISIKDVVKTCQYPDGVIASTITKSR
ncbi:hypothetical protein GJ496_005568 [Pomphorhynchus laevis]|nr:hypothetical protein GJ496_005568 [Pomphorhynchus laevis]